MLAGFLFPTDLDVDQSLLLLEPDLGDLRTEPDLVAGAIALRIESGREPDVLRDVPDFLMESILLFSDPDLDNGPIDLRIVSDRLVEPAILRSLLDLDIDPLVLPDRDRESIVLLSEVDCDPDRIDPPIEPEFDPVLFIVQDLDFDPSLLLIVLDLDGEPPVFELDLDLDIDPCIRRLDSEVPCMTRDLDIDLPLVPPVLLIPERDGFVPVPLVHELEPRSLDEDPDVPPDFQTLPFDFCIDPSRDDELDVSLPLVRDNEPDNPLPRVPLDEVLVTVRVLPPDPFRIIELVL